MTTLFIRDKFMKEKNEKQLQNYLGKEKLETFGINKKLTKAGEEGEKLLAMI